MPRSLLITEHVDKDVEGRILRENEDRVRK